MMVFQTRGFAAQATSKDQETEKLIVKITARTNQLEDEVKLLKEQIRQLKHQKSKSVVVKRQKQFKLPRPESTFRSYRFVKVHALNNKPTPYVKFRPNPVCTPAPEEDLAAYLLHGTAVVTSPYLGTRSAFDGSDLFVLNSGINQDVHLLREEKQLGDCYRNMGFPFPCNPILQLSGRIETQGIYTRNYSNASTSQTDLNLSTVELDLVPIVNEWTTGLVSYLFDNSATAPVRIRNSKIFLNNAFITIGNFNVTPFYLSMGQMYLPFAGQYSSFMLSAPFPQQVGQVRTRAFLLGYQPLSGNGLYAAIYGFTGDSYTSAHSRINFNDAGANLGFKYTACTWSSDIGASYIANIADALGPQLNLAPHSSDFIGFGNTFQSEQIEHRVPGVDAHTNFCFGNYRLFLEYVGATKAFARDNLRFNDTGASPKSANIEGAYKFNICCFPSSFAIGYARTWEAFPLNLPEQRYNATFNISFLKDTIFSIEYRHDINYPVGTTGGGNGPHGDFVEFIPPYTLGEAGDQVTAQFGMYW